MVADLADSFVSRGVIVADTNHLRPIFLYAHPCHLFVDGLYSISIATPVLTTSFMTQPPFMGKPLTVSQTSGALMSSVGKVTWQGQ